MDFDPSSFPLSSSSSPKMTKRKRKVKTLDPDGENDIHLLQKSVPRRGRKIVTSSDEEDTSTPQAHEAIHLRPSRLCKQPRIDATQPLYGGGKPRSRPSRPSASRSSHETNSHPRSRKPQTRSTRLPSPTFTSLESIASEDTSVRREIARLGLTLRDVTGDGNCLFRVLAGQLWGVQKRHGEVRKLVCDWLEMNGGVGGFVGEEDWVGYVRGMRQLKTFGSHVEIQAAATVFRRDIRVVMSTTSFTIPYLPSPSKNPLAFTEAQPSRSTSLPQPTPPPAQTKPPIHRTRSTILNLQNTHPDSPAYASALCAYIPPIRPGRSMLWLALFSQAEHFQSIRPKSVGGRGEQGGGVAGAEVEDRLAVPHEFDTSEAARRARGEEVAGDRWLEKDNGIKEVLRSLPPRHGFEREYIRGVLERTNGDGGETVDILLWEYEEGSGSESESEESGSTGVTTPEAKLTNETELGGVEGDKEETVMKPRMIIDLTTSEYDSDTKHTEGRGSEDGLAIGNLRVETMNRRRARM